MKTWKRMAKQRIVKPPFWGWSWELCHLYLHLVGTCQQIDLTWLLPQEHYCGAASNTGILNPVKYRKEGISHKDHIFILLPLGFWNLYTVNILQTIFYKLICEDKISYSFLIIMLRQITFKHHVLLHLTFNCTKRQVKQNNIRILALGIALEINWSSPCFSDEIYKVRSEQKCSVIQVLF